MKLVSVIFICLAFMLIFSCTRDRIMAVEGECLEEITYDEHMRPLINGTCAYNGCHLGGAAPGDYSDYEGIARYIDGGLIENRVLIARNMPPSNASQGPSVLTEEELELFKCWIQAGYPEN